MSEKPVVSVCMITYNHEDFISKAIEGVLMQETDFPVELVLGEDLSTDRTREICLEYQARYPGLITVLCRKNNLGMQLNFMSTIQACEGKYIAICEGDDYWTDPQKLTKQIEFMDKNPDFAICHHRLKIINEDGSNLGKLTPMAPKISTFEDLAARQQISTASCVFRNGLFEFPHFFTSVYGTDYALNLLNSFHGKIKFDKEVMGVYRMHDKGAWSGRGVIDSSELSIDTIRKCKDYFYPRAAAEFEFQATKAECFLQFEKRDFKAYRTQFSKILKYHRRFLKGTDFPGLLGRYFLSWSPYLIVAYTRASERLKTSLKS